MPIKFKYQPAGAIVGLAAYAAGQSKARERAMSGRRYPGRIPRSDEDEISGRWVDPLDPLTFKGSPEELQKARMQQQAQMRAVGRDPSRAQRYGTNNLIPRWQSAAEVKQMQKDQEEARKIEQDLADEARSDTRAWRRSQLSSMFSDLPKIPEHVEGDERRRLEGLQRDINKARYSRDLDPTDDDKFDEVAALVKEYNEAVGSVKPANPNQYGYVLDPQTKKLVPAGEQMAEYEWKPGMTSPVETEWFRGKKVEQAAQAELERKRAEAAEAAATKKVEERNRFQLELYKDYLKLAGTKPTGPGQKIPKDSAEAMEWARRDADEAFKDVSPTTPGSQPSAPSAPATPPPPPIQVGPDGRAVAVEQEPLVPVTPPPEKSIVPVPPGTVVPVLDQSSSEPQSAVLRSSDGRYTATLQPNGQYNIHDQNGTPFGMATRSELDSKLPGSRWVAPQPVPPVEDQRTEQQMWSSLGVDTSSWSSPPGEASRAAVRANLANTKRYPSGADNRQRGQVRDQLPPGSKWIDDNTVMLPDGRIIRRKGQ